MFPTYSILFYHPVLVTGKNTKVTESIQEVDEVDSKKEHNDKKDEPTDVRSGPKSFRKTRTGLNTIPQHKTTNDVDLEDLDNIDVKLPNGDHKSVETSSSITERNNRRGVSSSLSSRTATSAKIESKNTTSPGDLFRKNDSSGLNRNPSPFGLTKNSETNRGKEAAEPTSMSQRMSRFGNNQQNSQKTDNNLGAKTTSEPSSMISNSRFKRDIGNSSTAKTTDNDRGKTEPMSVSERMSRYGKENNTNTKTEPNKTAVPDTPFKRDNTAMKINNNRGKGEPEPLSVSDRMSRYGQLTKSSDNSNGKSAVEPTTSTEQRTSRFGRTNDNTALSKKLENDKGKAPDSTSVSERMSRFGRGNDENPKTTPESNPGVSLNTSRFGQTTRKSETDNGKTVESTSVSDRTSRFRRGNDTGLPTKKLDKDNTEPVSISERMSRFGSKTDDTVKTTPESKPGTGLNSSRFNRRGNDTSNSSVDPVNGTKENNNTENPADGHRTKGKRKYRFSN